MSNPLTNWPPVIDAANHSTYSWQGRIIERDEWTKKLSGCGFPDPPVLVDLSSHTDRWSKNLDEVLRASSAGHLPLVLGWGRFGHSRFRTDSAQYPPCAAVQAFPGWRSAGMRRTLFSTTPRLTNVRRGWIKMHLTKRNK